MKVDSCHIPEGRFFRFTTEKGIVWVRVEPHDFDERSARVSIFEEGAAQGSIGYPDQMAGSLPTTIAAHNRFGTGLILRIFRTVKASMPEVRKWLWERKFGINAGRKYERSG